MEHERHEHNYCQPWGPPGIDGEKGDKGCPGRPGKSFIVLGHVEIAPCEVEENEEDPVEVILKSIRETKEIITDKDAADNIKQRTTKQSNIEQIECFDTYIFPKGTKYVFIESIGAGGSGSANSLTYSGGGGSGGSSKCWLKIPKYIKGINVSGGIGGSPVIYIMASVAGNNGEGLNVNLVDIYDAILPLYSNPGGHGGSLGTIYGGLGGEITPAPISPLVIGFTSTKGNPGGAGANVEPGNTLAPGSGGIGFGPGGSVLSDNGEKGGGGLGGSNFETSIISGAGGNGVAWITAYGCKCHHHDEEESDEEDSF